MKFFTWVASVFLLAACDSAGDRASSVAALDFDLAVETERASAAVQAFAGELQAQLARSIQAGGPAAAIEVCHTEALDITRRVAAGHDLKLARVSLKYRNPRNDPTTWQALVLQDFEFALKSGEDPAGLEWSELAKAGKVWQFRYMKAIPTGGVCLQCHGTEIAPEVTEALAGLYPNDRATGFSEGDLRGAFVVTRKVR